VEAEDAGALTELTVDQIEKVCQKPFASSSCIPGSTGSDGASVMLGRHSGWNERIREKALALLSKEQGSRSYRSYRFRDAGPGAGVDP